MTQPGNQQIVARQVERIVRRLTSLSTLPSVAAGMLSRLNENAFDPVSLAESIQADPALTAQVLLVANREGVEFTEGPSVTEAVAKLSPSVLREAIISVKVFQLSEPGESADEKRALPRRQMALHSLAVACCAEELAQRVLAPPQRSAASLAGLLHDIGKCALDEVMPKSFEKMVLQARDEKIGLSDVEKLHLGLDHSVLGRRLAQKWNLPDPIVSAVWLHHCDAQTLSAELPHVQIARVVALADRLARHWQLGRSGSYDAPDSIDELAELLQLAPADLHDIEQIVTEKVAEKSRLLGLASADGTAEYYSIIRKTAADLVRDNRSLGHVRAAQQGFTVQSELIEQFLNDADENASAVELAQVFAGAWQKHNHSGTTGVYVVADTTEPWVEMAVLDRTGTVDVKSFRMPDRLPPVPEVLGRQFTGAPIAEGAQWLLEQTGVEFNAELTRMVPLRMGDKVAAVLVYEDMVQGGQDVQPPTMLSCKVAASTIMMALAVEKQYELSERFVEVMTSLRRTRTELAKTQSIAGLAEMAAGAAHELNNPLAVISGRAQLLLANEEDETKKQMLMQIQGRTAEISEIISDLMNFARPKPPEKRSATVRELIDKAIDLTQKTNGLSTMETELSGEGLAATVLLDVHQVTQSLACIMTNALQSYKGDNGPVWIDCQADGDTVSVTIRDEGCGMDAETLAKATEPFFSYRPAGRRRGMGLANVQRLLKLNDASVKLDSTPDQGTTVTVILPRI